MEPSKPAFSCPIPLKCSPDIAVRGDMRGKRGSAREMRESDDGVP